MVSMTLQALVGGREKHEVAVTSPQADISDALLVLESIAMIGPQAD